MNDTEAHNQMATLLAHRDMLGGLIISHHKATESMRPELRCSRRWAAVQWLICAVAVAFLFIDSAKWITFIWGSNLGMSALSLWLQWWPKEREAFAHWCLHIQMCRAMAQITAEIEARETGNGNCSQ